MRKRMKAPQRASHLTELGSRWLVRGARLPYLAWGGAGSLDKGGQRARVESRSLTGSWEMGDRAGSSRFAGT